MDVPVAIVTGSATGLGAAIALGLAARKYCIVLNCTKSFADAEEVRKAVAASGGTAIIAPGDVADPAACNAIAAAAINAYGRIDVLVNNAGTTKFAAHGDLDALEAGDFIQVYRVNVIGCYHMVRACRSALAKAAPGSVVNISSVAGMTGLGSSIAYAASKGALNAMTLSLARALAPEIRVNAVCPGFIDTRWFKESLSEERYLQAKQRMIAATPLGHIARADSVADAAIFLATEQSRHVTGELLIVDGGLHLRPTP